MAEEYISLMKDIKGEMNFNSLHKAVTLNFLKERVSFIWYFNVIQ